MDNLEIHGLGLKYQMDVDAREGLFQPEQESEVIMRTKTENHCFFLMLTV